jgi:serine/threonine-protein phosphatase 5
MNSLYGFEKECVTKYSQGTFDDVSELFNALPIGHLLNERVLIVHGGLPSNPTITIEKFQSANRFCQPPEIGPLNDILWADPMEQRGLAPSPRGVSSTFGPDITDRFLRANHIELIIRSHQVVENGYAIQHGGKCITVFSAPNYIGQMGNKGAVCNITFKPDGSVVYPLGFTPFDAKPIPAKYRPMQFASTFSDFF